PRLQSAWKHASEALTPYTCQHRIRTFDGTFAHVVSRAVPIFRDSEIREWIGMMTDVSDHVRVEEARELFIAILGHDLRSPLTSILSGADTLGLLESDEL